MPSGLLGTHCLLQYLKSKPPHNIYTHYSAKKVFFAQKFSFNFPESNIHILVSHLGRINTMLFHNLVMESQNRSWLSDARSLKEIRISLLLHQHLPQLNGQLSFYNLLHLGNAVHSKVPSSVQYIVLPKHQGLKVYKVTEFEKIHLQKHFYPAIFLTEWCTGHSQSTCN